MPPNTFYRAKPCQHSRSVSKEIPTHKNTDDYKRDSMIESPLVNTCTRNAYQRATVSVPVAIKPFSFAGLTKTYCCNDPVIKEIRCKPHCNTNEGVCYFTFSQEICVEVPIHFGAKACVGDSWVECHEASTEDCEDCI